MWKPYRNSPKISFAHKQFLSKKYWKHRCKGNALLRFNDFAIIWTLRNLVRTSKIVFLSPYHNSPWKSLVHPNSTKHEMASPILSCNKHTVFVGVLCRSCVPCDTLILMCRLILIKISLYAVIYTYLLSSTSYPSCMDKYLCKIIKIKSMKLFSFNPNQKYNHNKNKIFHIMYRICCVWRVKKDNDFTITQTDQYY